MGRDHGLASNYTRINTGFVAIKAKSGRAKVKLFVNRPQFVTDSKTAVLRDWQDDSVCWGAQKSDESDLNRKIHLLSWGKVYWMSWQIHSLGNKKGVGQGWLNWVGADGFWGRKWALGGAVLGMNWVRGWRWEKSRGGGRRNWFEETIFKFDTNCKTVVQLKFERAEETKD